jgi:hypothetical protein
MPPHLQYVPSHRMPLVVVDVADRGRWRRHEGVRGMVVRVVEEEGPHCCTHLSGSDPTQGGQWGEEEQRDVGGITWQKMSGWERRRRRRCTTRAMATTTTATGEGGGEGEVDMEGISGRVLLSSPCHSN